MSYKQYIPASRESWILLSGLYVFELAPNTIALFSLSLNSVEIGHFPLMISICSD